MIAALILAQTLFYTTVSIAIIVLGVLSVILVKYVIRIAQQLEKLSMNLNDASEDARDRINEIIDRLSELPIFSYFLKREPVHRETRRKGRGK